MMMVTTTTMVTRLLDAIATLSSAPSRHGHKDLTSYPSLLPRGLVMSQTDRPRQMQSRRA